MAVKVEIDEDTLMWVLLGLVGALLPIITIIVVDTVARR